MKQDFSHYQQEMGLAGARTAGGTARSTIRGRRCCMCPSACRAPTVQGYTQAVVEAVLPVVVASRGRAFLLFTSLRAMREAHAAAQGRLGP